MPLEQFPDAEEIRRVTAATEKMVRYLREATKNTEESVTVCFNVMVAILRLSDLNEEEIPRVLHDMIFDLVPVEVPRPPTGSTN